MDSNTGFPNPAQNPMQQPIGQTNAPDTDMLGQGPTSIGGLPLQQREETRDQDISMTDQTTYMPSIPPVQQLMTQVDNDADMLGKGSTTLPSMPPAPIPEPAYPVEPSTFESMPVGGIPGLAAPIPPPEAIPPPQGTFIAPLLDSVPAAALDPGPLDPIREAAPAPEPILSQTPFPTPVEEPAPPSVIMDNTHLATPDPEFVTRMEKLGGLAALQFKPDQDPLQLQSSSNLLSKVTSVEMLKANPMEVTWRDLDIPSSLIPDPLHTEPAPKLEARVYTPPKTPSAAGLPILLYFHGGGYITGSLDTEDAFCCILSTSLHGSGSPMIIVSVNYRHAPQFAYPTQVNDARDVFDYIYKNPQKVLGEDADPGVPPRIVVGGISHGATLAASIALRETDHVRATTATAALAAQNDNLETATPHDTVANTIKNRVHGAWLACPSLCDGSLFPRTSLAPTAVFSEDQCIDAPYLNTMAVAYYNNNYIRNEIDRASRFVSPALLDHKELIGYPKTVMHIDGWDPLRDGALLFAAKVTEAGGDVQAIVYPGVPHAHWRIPELEMSKRFMMDMVTGIKRLAE